MMRCKKATLALAMLCLSGVALAADDKAAKPTGSWERTLGDNSMRFDFKADDNMLITLKAGEAEIKITATYAVKDGVLSGVMKKIERKGIDGGPEEGEKFNFRYKVEKDKMTVSELKPTDSDEIKQLVEGEYKKAKEKDKEKK